MATIKVTGDAVVITSTLKLEDILTVQKYRPSALVLRGGEDGKEPIFAIEARVGAQGKINEIGATFGSASRDGNGFATITYCLSVPAETDVRELLADQLGAALVNLGKLEATIPTVLAEVVADREAIKGAIAIG